MTPRSLKILTGSSWVVLSVCTLVLLFLAVTIPNVISESIIKDCDKNVQEIRSSTDLHEVQQIATWRTQGEAYTSESARMLLIIAVVTLLLCMICSGVSLLQIRRLKKQLYDTKSAG
jgi:ABC-type Fe3+ transport system permease subunit